MATARWVAQVGTSGIHPVFVGEDAFKNKDFFSSWMSMRRERRSGCIANDTGHDAKRLVAYKVAALDSWRRRRFPR
jgi:hypothetical protein